MDANEAAPILRSLNNRHSSFVRFVNTTSYHVDVLWLDYQGTTHSYGTLSPGDRLNINTFATHPWIFEEKDTRDRFTVDGKCVFYPQAWFAPYINMPRHEVPQMIGRIQVNITLPIYTLRDLSLRVIKRRLRHDNHAFRLEIPRSLQYELASMLPRKRDTAESPQQEELASSL